MNMKLLLAELKLSGISLQLNGDKLNIKSSTSPIPADVLSKLKQNKAELLEHLQKAQLNSKSNQPLSAAQKLKGLKISSQQRSLWPLYKMGQGSTYNIPLRYDLRGNLNVEHLEAALIHVYQSFDALHSSFTESSNDVKMHAELDANWKPEVFSGNDSNVHKCYQQELEREFDLSTGHLFVARLIQLTTNHHVLLLNFPHIIIDGWSIEQLWTTLAAYYNVSISDDIPKYGFLDYLKSLNQSSLEQKYWLQRLQDYDTIQWHNIASPASFENDAHIRYQNLEDNILVKLKKRAQEANVSLFGASLYCFGKAIAQYLGCQEVVISTPFANRSGAQWQGVVGYFVSMLPVRLNRKQSMTSFQLQLQKDIEHELVDINALLPELGLQSVNGQNPLQQIVFAWQEGVLNKKELQGVEVEQRETELSRSKFPLSLSVLPAAKGYQLKWEYDQKLLSIDTIVLLESLFIEQITSASLQRPQIINDKLSQKSVLSLFESHVQKSPKSVAIRAGLKSLTYIELWEQGQHIANHLLSKGITKGEAVGVCMARDLPLATALLGIVMAGAVYVPLSIEEPEIRIQEQVDQCNLRFCLTDNDLLSTDNDLLSSVIPLQLEMLLEDHCPLQQLPEVTPQDPIYINFSSGTTGKPKGIKCLHKGVVRLVEQADYMELDSDTRMLSAASLSFDAFTLEFWGPLLNGGAVHLLTEPHLDSIQLKNFINEQRVNCAWFTAALFHTLVDTDVSAFIGLKQLLVGGDVVSPSHVRQLYEIDNQIRIINGYGPTENTTFTSCFTIPRDWPVSEALPIGRSIRGTQVCLLDDDGFAVPQGAIGELVTAGAGLAQGYLNESEEVGRFIELQLQNGSCKAYRTGDLAFVDVHGEIRFVGRKDQQVKVNGFRVELHAIDRQLVALPEVTQAVTVILKEGGRQQLVSFVRLVSPAPALQDGGQFRLDLKKVLPHYMVPGVILSVPEICLTRNGKVDRRVLSQLFNDWSTSSLSISRPLTEVEATVATIWQDILVCGPVKASSDFFMAGGNSILAIRVAGKIGKILNLNLGISDVLGHPVLSDFCHYIEKYKEQEQQSESPLSTYEKLTGVSISPQQSSLWPLYKMGRAKAYNMPMCYQLTGNLDLVKLQNTLQQLYHHIEPLHSIFVEQGDDVIMMPASKSDWRAEYHEVDDATIEVILQQEVEREFDLTHDALFVAHICLLAPERYALVINFPHIVMDGWSVDLFWKNLNRLYLDNSLDRAFDYYDYLSQKQNSSMESDYWQKRLAGCQSPTPHNLAPLQSGGAKLGRYSVKTSASDLKSLQQIASEAKSTLFCSCLKLWGNTMARFLGTPDIVISTPYANRQTAFCQSIIGYLVSMVPVRINEQQPLSQFQSLLLNDLAEADFDFNALLAQLDMQTEAGAHPLQNLVFSWQENLEEQVQLGDLRVHRDKSPAVYPKFPLSLTVYQLGKELQFTWDFDTAIYSEVTVQRLAKLLFDSIRGRSTPQLETSGELVYQSSGEPSQLLRLLETQVNSQPNKIAIKAGTASLSYQELWKQAQHLAGILQQLDVGVGESVALAMPRSAHLSIALVAIAMTGAVYVPLAEDNSEQYLQKLATDANIRYCLTEKASVANMQCLSVAKLLQSKTDRYIPPLLRATSALYINFSSGTTGKPKGIICLHQGVTRLVKNPNFMYLGTNTHMLCAATPTFDAFTLEFWGPLLNGGCVHMLTKEQLDTEQLRHQVECEGVNTLWLTAALFHMFVDIDIEAFNGIEQVLTGGDVVSTVHCKKLYQVNSTIRIINGYGPTENTTFTCCFNVVRNWPDNEALPIGYSIQGTDVFLLDAELRPVPDGCIGELVTTGKGLAAGYLDKAQETNRFIELHLPHGYIKAYRTGDLAYRDHHGRYCYVGRADQMVKVNGFRVELEAIDRALIELSNVQNAITLAIKNANTQQLVSFILTTDEVEKTTSAYQLLAGLTARLPSHMLPAAILKVPKFPVSNSNKVDRQKLIKQYRDWVLYADQQKTTFTPSEMKVAKVWQTVLNVDTVQAQSHFYQLGGNSLLLLKAHAGLMEAFDCHLDYVICIEHLLLSELAQAIENSVNTSGATLPSVEVLVDCVFPLSTEQRRLYLTQALQPSTAYNIPCLIPLPIDINYQKACLLVHQLLRAHPILAVKLIQKSDQVLQRIKPAHEFVPAQHQCDSLDEMENLFSSLGQRQIDLFESVIDCHYINMDDRHPWMVLTIHHIVFDGQSIQPLMQSLKSLLTSDMPKIDDTFFRHISWQQSDAFNQLLEQQASYWHKRLSNVDKTTMLPYFNTPSECRRAKCLSFNLPTSLIAEVNKLNRQLNISEFTFWAGLLCLFLGRTNHSRSATLATPVAKRVHQEEFQSVGFFANTLMLNADWTEDISVVEYLTRLQKQVSEDLCHQLVPLDQVMAIHKQQRHSPNSLSEVLFSLNRVENNEQVRFGSNPDVKYDFSLTLSFSESEARAHVEYRQCAYKDEMITEVISTLTFLANQIVINRNSAIADLKLVDQESNKEFASSTIVKEWPDLVPIQILKTATRYPERIAITDSKSSLTYKQLAEGAKRISAHLQSAGVKPGDRVAVMMNRHIGLPQTLLAVLLAGATYVPLDPDYPKSRLDYFLQDAQPWGGICDAEYITQWQTGKWLDYRGLATTPSPTCWQSVDLDPDHLSHLIYTSGSSGEPKGVMVKHRGVRALFAWASNYYSTAELQNVYGATSVCFDLSVFEIFITWGFGGTLHFAQNALDLLKDSKVKPISLINTVPSVLQEVLKFQSLNSNIKVVNLAGEPLPPDLAKRLYESNSDLRVINLYGPSEDTTYSTVFEVDKNEPQSIFIGKPLPGTTAMVCDAQGRQLPKYFSGELVLFGEGLANGYFNKPELSREKFVETSEHDAHYKTGDLVRYVHDYQLEYIGRIDDQIKLRGFRIELGEINNLILAHPQVLESCTLVMGEAGEEYITSFVTASTEFSDISQIQHSLATKLPSYMLPSKILVIDKIPLTPSGKQDKKALKDLVSVEPESNNFDWSGLSYNTQWCKQVFGELLPKAEIGPESSFFEHGGNSLLAVSLVKAIRKKFNLEITFKELFAYPNPIRLGSWLDNKLNAAQEEDEGIII